MQWVLLQSFSFPYEAQIAKSQLHAFGISARIENEHTINMDWLYSNALGGVRLLVLESDIEEAKQLLDQDYSDAVDDIFNIDHPKCPRCQSSEIIAYTKGKKPAFIVLLLFWFPLSKLEHGYRCQSCDHFFKL